MKNCQFVWDGILYTECKYYIGLMIGSKSCISCKYNFGTFSDKFKNYVQCKADEENDLITVLDNRPSISYSLYRNKLYDKC